MGGIVRLSKNPQFKVDDKLEGYKLKQFANIEASQEIRDIRKLIDFNKRKNVVQGSDLSQLGDPNDIGMSVHSFDGLPSPYEN